MPLGPNTVEPKQFKALVSDLSKSEEQLHSEDCQFWRRNYIRTAFSLVEAMNNSLKEKAMLAATSGDKTSYNTTRIELLGDYTYRIEKNGRIEGQEQRFPFLNYTAFVLRSLCEESYVEPNFFSDNGWSEFQKAVQIRHRLTHPKIDTDLDISDQEVKTMRAALAWFHNSILHAFSNTSFWTTVESAPAPLPSSSVVQHGHPDEVKTEERGGTSGANWL